MIQLPKLNLGIHRGIPASEYHGIKWAASASTLRSLHGRTPAHLRMEIDEPREVTFEMVFGELIHQRILEPNRPLPSVAIVPETYVVPDDYKGGKNDPKPGDVEPWNWRRKYCRQWKDKQVADGKIIITMDESEELDKATERVMSNSEARELIEGADTEVTLFWETVAKFPCKARLDLVPSGPRMGDIKSTNDASMRWQKHAVDMGYHIQAAWYMDAWANLGDNRFTGFSFIAYERGSGLVLVHRMSQQLLNIGRAHYQQALATYIQAVTTDTWPGFSETGVDFDAPKWMNA